jgi:hypothetical protein
MPAQIYWSYWKKFGKELLILLVPHKSHRINGPCIFVCSHNPKVVSSNLTPAPFNTGGGHRRPPFVFPDQTPFPFSRLMRIPQTKGDSDPPLGLTLKNSQPVRPGPPAKVLVTHAPCKRGVYELHGKRHVRIFLIACMNRET